MSAAPDLLEQFRVAPQRADRLVEMGFSPNEIYKIVAPRRTLDRRKKNAELLTIPESDRVVRLERIIALAERVFGEADKAHRWLRRPNRALNGVKPADLLESENGARKVEGLVHAVDHGMFS